MKILKKHYLGLLLSGIFILAFLLRFVNVTSIPPSLYWDEVSQGYNAYSVLTTGRDEHGEFLPLARFVAFGDYKAPVYTYTIIPFMALFGKTDLAVRLPSVILGTLSVVVLYYLCRELVQKKAGVTLGLFAALFLAIAPWHIQLSRAAYEGNIAVFFTLAGSWAFLFALRKNAWMLVPSSILFVIAFYSFNVQKVFVPLFIALLIAIYARDIWQHKKEVIISALLALVMLIPYAMFFTSPESKLRFNEVNIFSDLSVIEESNKLQSLNDNSQVSQVLFNRRVLYAREYLENYFDFYNPDFLFISGDGNPRFSTQNNGGLYLWQLPLLLIGAYQVIKWRNKSSLFIFGWLLLAPVAAATARETPHALRAELMLPIFAILSASGLGTIFSLTQNRKILHISAVAIFVFLASFSTCAFVYNYFTHFPKEYSGEWQYGYREMVKRVEQLEDNYENIYITNTYGRPYIYLLFYSGISPREYIEKGEVIKDEFGLYNVKSFGKYKFVDALPDILPENSLVVFPKDSIPTSVKSISTIKFLNGKNAFVIAGN